jgi:hypothetical protein
MTQYTEDRPHARRAVVRVLLLAAFSAATLTQAQANGAPDSVSGAVPDSVMPTPAPLPPPPTIAETARERPPFAAGISINALLRRDYTDRIRLPIGKPGSAPTTLGSAWQELEERLSRAHYDRAAVYSIDSVGVALVCPVEHIDDNGQRKDPAWGWEPSHGGLREFFASVFGHLTERYRIMMILAPAAPPAVDSTPPDQDYANRLVKGGQLSLPAGKATEALRDSFCEVRVFEFFKKDENSIPALVLDSTIKASRHVERSGLWSKEEIR